MAVIAVWQCDRDGSMFQDKKEAEEYDKMLELAENISELLNQHLPGGAPEHNEAVGLFLAKHRDLLARACKGKPELLLEEITPPESAGKVTSLVAKG
jgi:dsDNA-binding SOS-regulon protein